MQSEDGPSTVRREGNPFITKVSNIRENGVLIGSLPDGEMLFHADSAFNELPHRASFLFAIEIPSTGGNTCFANMYKAYDMLPEALKQRLVGKKALQVYDYATYEKTDQAAGTFKCQKCRTSDCHCSSRLRTKILVHQSFDDEEDRGSRSDRER